MAESFKYIVNESMECIPYLLFSNVFKENFCQHESASFPYSLEGDSSSKLSFLESSRSFSGLYPLDHQGLYSSFAALLDAVVALEVRLKLDKLLSNGSLEEIMKLENCIKPHHCQGFSGITV